MNLPRLIVLIATVFAVCLLSVGDVEAQLPPHNPVLNWTADYWTTVGKTDGYEFNNSEDQWLDNVSGAIATPFGAEAEPGQSMTFHTNQLNGHAVVRNVIPLPDNNQWWVQDTEMIAHAPNLLVGSNDYTIVAVIKPHDPPAEVTNIGVVGTWGNPDNYRNQWYLSGEPDAIGGGYQRHHGGSFFGSFSQLSNFGISTSELYDWHSFGWVKSGGATPVVNGHTDGVTGPAFGGLVSSDLGVHDQGGIGRRLNFMHSGNHFHGDFAEIIFWDYALSESQLADVDAYLANRYIPEPSTSFLALIGLAALSGRLGICRRRSK